MTTLVADSSALVAVVLGDPEAEVMLHAMSTATRVLVSAVGVVEAGMVADARRGVPGRDRLTTLLSGLDVEVVAVDAELADRALAGWRRFGTGRHPASLNVGDCFSYALASREGLPILFVGHDFRQTDLMVEL